MTRSSDLYIVTSPSLATSQEGLIALNTSNNRPDDSIRSYLQAWVVQSPVEAYISGQVSKNILKNHEKSKEINSLKTKRVVKRTKLYEKHQEKVKYKKNMMLL